MTITTETTCRECGRTFDLLDETEAEEWAEGHDCEVRVTTYDEACNHVAAMYAKTDGMVVGGTYRVRFPSGRVGEVELRVTTATGTVRAVA